MFNKQSKELWSYFDIQLDWTDLKCKPIAFKSMYSYMLIEIFSFQSINEKLSNYGLKKDYLVLYIFKITVSWFVEFLI